MILILLAFYLLFNQSIAEEMIEEINTIQKENEHVFVPVETEQLVAAKNIEDALEKMENIAALAEKSRSEGILPTEHAEELHNQMVGILQDIIEQLKNPLNIYKFLNSKGVDKIITPIIGINYAPIKKQLLILIKTLFYVAPTTTNALIPVSIVDKLLDIFEHDDNLALKTHALDILYIWLPNNPKIQARVMKLKGLEPFYHQFSKLDDTVIHTMLDLFNKILEEHLAARNNKSQNKDDYEKMKLYQMIGLIERMATPPVCNGLLNILEALITFTNNDQQLSISIFELVKNIKPFCLNMYKGKDKAIKLFDELKKYVTDPSKVKLMQNVGVNVTEIEMVVNDFAMNVKETVRDEF